MAFIIVVDTSWLEISSFDKSMSGRPRNGIITEALPGRHQPIIWNNAS